MTNLGSLLVVRLLSYTGTDTFLLAMLGCSDIRLVMSIETHTHTYHAKAGCEE